MASLNAELFTYDFPKVGVSMVLSAFPSLSDLGHIRLVYVFSESGTFRPSS